MYTLIVAYESSEYNLAIQNEVTEAIRRILRLPNIQPKNGTFDNRLFYDFTDEVSLDDLEEVGNFLHEQGLDVCLNYIPKQVMH